MAHIPFGLSFQGRYRGEPGFGVLPGVVFGCDGTILGAVMISSSESCGRPPGLPCWRRGWEGTMWCGVASSSSGMAFGWGS